MGKALKKTQIGAWAGNEDLQTIYDMQGTIARHTGGGIGREEMMKTTLKWATCEEGKQDLLATQMEHFVNYLHGNVDEPLLDTNATKTTPAKKGKTTVAVASVVAGPSSLPNLGGTAPNVGGTGANFDQIATGIRSLLPATP